MYQCPFHMMFPHAVNPMGNAVTKNRPKELTVPSCTEGTDGDR